MRSQQAEWAIMQIRFMYIIEDRDRHGNIRVYVRVPGRRKVRIRAPFGTDKFIAAYASIRRHNHGGAGRPMGRKIAGDGPPDLQKNFSMI